jgi:hypothetical protein
VGVLNSHRFLVVVSGDENGLICVWDALSGVQVPGTRRPAPQTQGSSVWGEEVYEVEGTNVSVVRVWMRVRVACSSTKEGPPSRRLCLLTLVHPDPPMVPAARSLRARWRAAHRACL